MDTYEKKAETSEQVSRNLDDVWCDETGINAYASTTRQELESKQREVSRHKWFINHICKNP